MEGSVVEDVRSSLKDCAGKVKSADVVDEQRREASAGDEQREEVVLLEVVTLEGDHMNIRASEAGYQVVSRRLADNREVRNALHTPRL